jgi:hypothetical protein
MVDGYEEAMGSGITYEKSSFGDSGYSWSYGSRNNGNIKSYKIQEPQYATSASNNLVQEIIMKKQVKTQDMGLEQQKVS